MLPEPMIRDWARRLIASEVDQGSTFAQAERVYERLRGQLCAPVGVDGFQALASRALSLAKSQSPRLSEVQVLANGGLSGFSNTDLASGANTDEDSEVGITLIAQLLGLFLTLVGEAATVRLVADVPLRVEVEARPDATEKSISPPSTNYFGPFKDILLEADQLRSVSERLEVLVDKHADINEMMSVVGSIRDIATVLDVFTLIRGKADGSQDSEVSLPTNGYVN